MAAEMVVDGTLYRVHNAGRPHVRAFLDDHAALLGACLDLQRAGASTRYLEPALWLAVTEAARLDVLQDLLAQLVEPLVVPRLHAGVLEATEDRELPTRALTCLHEPDRASTRLAGLHGAGRQTAGRAVEDVVHHGRRHVEHLSDGLRGLRGPFRVLLRGVHALQAHVNGLAEQVLALFGHAVAAAAQHLVGLGGTVGGNHLVGALATGGFAHHEQGVKQGMIHVDFLAIAPGGHCKVVVVDSSNR